ncbi:hypothetical protein AURDEDRAFT_113657 [Auricularia subglabra TFB-10046 SS5]|nr:hypothetical protein AURDEDRAFT_113657 [Auricularia subglabra TFB-10046 SS5]
MAVNKCHAVLWTAMVSLWSILIIGALRLQAREASPTADPRQYTWIGKDYPRTWDVEVGKAHKPTEDSVHLRHDTPLGRAGWASMMPSGGGMLYLGPQRRKFSISMFHQLRCLDIIGLELQDRLNETTWTTPTPLARHCMNYLRQMILCRADTRLEAARSINLTRLTTSSVTHTCNDWSAVYAAAERNYLEYGPK